jgi:hypothetical protein
MRASGVAARRNPPQAPPPQPQQQQQPGPPPGPPAFTLQQVISLIDARLTAVEKRAPAAAAAGAPGARETDPVLDDIIAKINNMATYMNDVDARFNMLIDELDTLKSTVMSLQTYTMDVNKKLLEVQLAAPAQAPVQAVTEASLESFTPVAADTAVANDAPAAENIEVAQDA